MIPASFEILGFVLLAPYILGIDRIEAAVMGSVLAAVSPAVVVPIMVRLMESGYGADKSIPQLILAGASCDDIFVVVVFSSFVEMAQGGVHACSGYSECSGFHNIRRTSGGCSWSDARFIF